MRRRKIVSWTRWRHQRIVSLIREGMQVEIAKRIGKAETAARRRLGMQIGWREARSAQLLCISEGATIRFALAGDFTQLTPEQTQRLLDMRNVSAVLEPAGI